MVSMAAEAEAPRFEELQTFNLNTTAGFVMSQADVYIAADAIPDLRRMREEADAESAEVFESRMQFVRDGEADLVPYDVDPITAADQYLQARKLYGEDSPECREKWDGLIINAQRFYAETYSKNGSEYFAPLRHEYSADEEDYISYGVPVMQTLNQGITPIAEDYEVPRRFMEYREAATAKRVGELLMRAAGVNLVADNIPRIGLPAEIRASRSVSSVTVSECPDEVIAMYKSDQLRGIERSYGGYAPQIEKIMIRSERFDTEDGCSYVEQMSVSGKYITHDVILRSAERKQVIAEGATLSKVDVLGMQVLTTQQEGVVGELRLLDEIASEMSGLTIFKGEPVPADHPKNYSVIPAEAVERQAKQADDAVDLACYLVELAESDIDHWLANIRVEARVHERMFAAAKYDVGLAARAFGEATAKKVSAIICERSQGNYVEAIRLEQLAEATAPPVEGCGAGSCGIESLSVGDAQSAQAIKLGLKPDRDGNLLKDNVRRCRNTKCKARAIVYSVHNGKVSKACTACGEVNLN